MSHHQVLIVGGGTAGITAAAHLRKLANPPQVTIIDPAQKHYYQPLFTLVGGGVMPLDDTWRPEDTLIPPGVALLRDSVETFDPDNNAVTTRAGDTHTYDWLVVAPGIQLDWHKIEGLAGNVGKNGIVSNYSPDYVESTWEALRNLKGGNAIFTFPDSTIKCPGAPQKIMWLADDYLRKNGLRDKVNVIYASRTESMFGVPRYAAPLNKMREERGVIGHFRRNLYKIDATAKKAWFKALDGGDDLVLDYEMIHVVPPQSAPDFVKNSPLANAEGWVDVDAFTTQHNRWSNIFSVGDASGMPNSKTGAAVRKQAPVMVANFDAVRKGLPLPKRYNGYASCPLVTGYGTMMLAEFGYDGEIMETMPFDQDSNRFSMYAAKTYALPLLYWHGMLKARW